MSADLLAEFDSFYQAPNSQPANNTAVSNYRSASALEELSLFETLNTAPTTSGPPQPQLSKTTSKSPEGSWGHFGVHQAGPSHRVAASQAFDLWDSFGLAEKAGGDSSRGNQSQNAGHERSASDWNKPAIVIPKPGIIRASTEELFSTNIADLAETQAAQEDGATVSRGTRSDVLFDADEFSEEDDDDEFGEFETVGSSIPRTDLLPLEPSIVAEKTSRNPPDQVNTEESLTASSFPYPQAPRSPSFQERNPFADLALSTSSISDNKKADDPAENTPVTAWPSYEPEVPAIVPYHDSPTVQGPEDEDWGEFADLPPEAPEPKPSKDIEADAWTWDTVDNQIGPTSAPERVPESPPPTNIPPPSVLLTVFPQLFNLPQSNLFQVVANQTFSLKNRILSDPSTIDFLRGYILIATVAARITAGRKLRWKRDTHLSQAMKIGPAAAHGKGGMKLFGVDKAETTKEEREATELIRIWKENVGRLRSAVAAANSSLHDPSAHLVVPELVETMTVKVEGALTGPKACVVCGLRREEKIPKVDHRVEDSFGEWWVEHWGHRACKNFWQEHENELRSR